MSINRFSKNVEMMNQPSNISLSETHPLSQGPLNCLVLLDIIPLLNH